MGDGIDGPGRAGGGRGEDDKRRGDGRGSQRPQRVRPTPEARLSRSLEYGLAMLECFRSQRASAGVVDLAAALALGRSTAHRYASTLHALGYLEQDEHRKYQLSARALEPGIAAIDTVREWAAADVVLEELCERTGHTVGLGALEGTRAVYVHRLHAHRAGQYAADLDLRAGASVPLHCTAVGKALIASLADAERQELIDELQLTRCGPGSVTSRRRLTAEVKQVGERGLSIADEEQAAGVRSIAVATSGRAGPWLMAVEVTVPARVWTVARLRRELGPLVREAALRIPEGRPPNG